MLKQLVGILLTLVVALLGQPGLAPAAPPAPSGTAQPQISLGDSSAEVTLPTPAWYAVLRGPGEAAAIYTKGEAIFPPGETTRSFTVRQVRATALVLQESPSGTTHTLSPGTSLPGFPALTFTQAVHLDRLTYRYQQVEQVTRPDPRLVVLEGSRAVLDIEVSRWFSVAVSPSGLPASPSSPQTQTGSLDPAVLEKVRVRERAPNTYEVPAEDMQSLLNNADQVAANLLPQVRPYFSVRDGLNYRLTGPAGEGVLTGQGFTITSMKVANQIGLQAGDTIRSINGRPVDGFASAFRIYYDIRRDSGLSTVRVDLLRGGAPVTMTYRIR